MWRCYLARLGSRTARQQRGSLSDGLELLGRRKPIFLGVLGRAGFAHKMTTTLELFCSTTSSKGSGSSLDRLAGTPVGGGGGVVVEHTRFLLHSYVTSY